MVLSGHVWRTPAHVCMRRLLQAAGAALLHPATQPFAALWLDLIQQTLSLAPQHTGAAALMLPLRISADSDAAAAAAAAAATSGSHAAEAAVQAAGAGEQLAGAAAAGSQGHALLETWRLVGAWLASADVKGRAQLTDSWLLRQKTCCDPQQINT